jgi:CBS domain-containing protein
MNLVQHILDGAQRRLATLSLDSLLSEAALILANPDTPLVVVCDAQGIAVGVLTKTDIVKSLARERGIEARAGSIMAHPVVFCDVEQTLQRVWEAMHARSLRSVPILNGSGRPVGVVHARDLAQALLDETNEEEIVLRDYFLGVGYQ